MKKPSRNKSTSSTVSANTTASTSPTVSEFELFSSYSHEQVHIHNKLCSSVSSTCEIAYCTSDGIFICVPETCPRYSLNSTPQTSSSSSLSSMVVARIDYPFASTDQSTSISPLAPALLAFERLKKKNLPRLYNAYKHRPTSLSCFDRLLCPDTTQYKGFRSCIFSPGDIARTHGQSVLAAITCAHELFIYEIVSSSKRFYVSESSHLKVDLTTRLLDDKQFDQYLHDSYLEDDYRQLYIHLTCAIAWDASGTRLFQLQYSGHVIIWKFDGSTLINDQLLPIIDTHIGKPLSMAWNDECQMLLVIGKENRRVLIRMTEKMQLINITMNDNDNDSMNAEYGIFIKWDAKTILLIESKMHYCLIYSIVMEDDQSSILCCNQLDWRVLPSSIVGIQQQQYSSSTNHLSVLLGCEDGSIHSLSISREAPLTVDMKLVTNGQVKSCSRKPLLLRHFSLSSNELLLARIFYSPIVAPNVKFGFVLCAVHRWTSDLSGSFDKCIDTFLNRNEMPLWRSSDELALILNEVTRGSIHHHRQTKKNTTENASSLQRLCRLYTLLEHGTSTKQLQTFENQLLQIYRHRLSRILTSLFADTIEKLSPVEQTIYMICSGKELSPSVSLLQCSMCDASLTITTTDLLTCTCPNKHVWPRCSRTLLPLHFEHAQTCSLCDRTITLIDSQNENYANFAVHQNNELNFLFSTLCTYCL